MRTVNVTKKTNAAVVLSDGFELPSAADSYRFKDISGMLSSETKQLSYKRWLSEKATNVDEVPSS